MGVEVGAKVTELFALPLEIVSFKVGLHQQATSTSEPHKTKMLFETCSQGQAFFTRPLRVPPSTWCPAGLGRDATRGQGRTQNGQQRVGIAG